MALPAICVGPGANDGAPRTCVATMSSKTSSDARRNSIPSLPSAGMARAEEAVSRDRLIRQLPAPYLGIRVAPQLPRRRGPIEALRYDAVTAAPLSEGEITLAREKNTSRAEARRRIRAEQRADYLAATAPDMTDEADLEASGSAEVPTERKPMFKMPNFRADIRGLPGMFRSKPVLFLPLVILIIGFGIFLALPGLSPDTASFAGLYIQFFWAPPALFTFFIAGFFAPRAAYLVGFIYGVIAGLMWGSAVLLVGSVDSSTGIPTATAVEPVPIVLNMLVVGMLYGTLAAALASWYREFLRGIQERGRAKRADREVEEREKRRLERQEARKLAKQRPIT